MIKAVLTVALATSLALTALAADNLYTNAGSGKWEAPADWSLGAPNTNQSIYITNAGTKTVTIDGTTSGSFSNTMSVSALFIGAPTNTAINTLSLTNAGTNVPLRVAGSFDLQANGTIAINNAALQVNGLTRVGSIGSATFTLNSGTATIADLQVGDGNGVGTLNINGGTLTIPAGGLYVAGSSSSTGVVSIASGHLAMNGSGMVLGSAGRGQMTVSGGTAQIPSIQIGNAAGTTGSLTVSGGSVSVPNWVWIGNNVGASVCTVAVHTNGSLYITNAGHSAYVDIARGSSLTLTGGFVQVDNLILTNGGSLTNISGTFQFTGPYQVEGGAVAVAGGTLQAGSSFIAGANSGSTGTVAVTGSILSVTNGVFGLGNNGTTTNGSGTGSLTVSNATVLAATLTLGSTAGGIGIMNVLTNAAVIVGSDLTVLSGSLSNTSSVTVAGGSLTATNGIIAVGPAGSGSMAISAGTVTANQVKLGGTTPGSSGTLTLGAGGHLKFLSRVSANAIVLEGGDIDGNGGGAMYVGEGHDAAVFVTQGSITKVSTITVGYVGGYTGTLTVGSLGWVQVATNLIVGDCASSALGLVTLNGGALYVTNATHTAFLDVRDGAFTMNGGRLVVDTLIITNPCARFVNNGGSITYNNPLRPGPVLAANLDADGDGQTNGQEAQAGTDPLDPGSNFRLLGASIINGHDVQVDWTAVAGHSYVVQMTTNMPTHQPAIWTDLSPVIAVTDPNATSANYVHAGGATNRTGYYRVRLSQ